MRMCNILLLKRITIVTWLYYKYLLIKLKALESFFVSSVCEPKYMPANAVSGKFPALKIVEFLIQIS